MEVNSTKELRIVSLSCKSCGKTFPKSYNLKRHVKNVHSSESETRECTAANKIFECPCCNACVSKDNLSIHFQEEHEIRIETENVELATFEDFKSWKEAIEKESKCKYVAARGAHTKSTGKTHYFRCHRSGNFKSTGNGLRNIRMQGTNNIGKFCPAYIRVFEEKSGKCSVAFTKTHVGHSSESECTAANKIFECPCCNACVLKDNLSVHFQEEHEIYIETENIELATFEDFKSWKEAIENETKFKYVKVVGAQTKSTGKTHYFRCHRSGKFKPTGNGLIHIKKQGINKIRKFCPAYMRVFEKKDGKCSITFTKTHVGHPSESETQECAAANKIFECPCCNACILKDNLSVHFQEKHEIHIETENVVFATYEDFKSWKEVIEKETKFKYVAARGAQIKSTGKTHYFRCHRSGKFKPTGNGLRNLKKQGSYKIGKFCPAYMRVFEEKNGKCSITFTKTHVGHQNELGHLFLSKPKRKNFAEKNAAKLPFNVILDNAKGSVSETSGLKRPHLLTKTDLYNTNSFHLDSSADNLSICMDGGNAALEEYLQETSKVMVSSAVDINKERECVRQYTLKVLDSLNTVEELAVYKRQVMTVKPIVSSIRSRLENTSVPETLNNTPTNKNIIPQRGLYTTKKLRKSTKNPIIKPTMTEEINIAVSVISNDETHR